MQITAQEICSLINGTLEGDPAILISGPSKIEEGKVGTISFLANPKYEQYVYTTKASVLLVSKEFQPKQAISSTLIRVEDVYAAVAFLLEKFGQSERPTIGIDSLAFIKDGVRLGTNVTIGAFAVIEAGAHIGDNCIIYPQVYVGKDVIIGENCILYPGTKVYRDCKIGQRCILHANVVIGSDGFGFAPQEDGSYKKIPQTGNVVIEDEVEIGANTVIDRASMGSTIIQKGAKLDNLIQIAHNVVIGKNTVIAAQAGIAGSSKIGEQCMIGGQAGFVGHIEIADGTKVQAQSGINRSIKQANTAVYGSPALAYKNYLKSYAVFKNLPQLAKKIHDLEQKIKDLDENHPSNI